MLCAAVFEYIKNVQQENVFEGIARLLSKFYSRNSNQYPHFSYDFDTKIKHFYNSSYFWIKKSILE